MALEAEATSQKPKNTPANMNQQQQQQQHQQQKQVYNHHHHHDQTPSTVLSNDHRSAASNNMDPSMTTTVSNGYSDDSKPNSPNKYANKHSKDKNEKKGLEEQDEANKNLTPSQRKLSPAVAALKKKLNENKNKNKNGNNGNNGNNYNGNNGGDYNDHDDDDDAMNALLWWCYPLLWITTYGPKHWPRCYAIFFGMIVPLWLLIFLAAGFGALLATYEYDSEIDSNDFIMAARALVDKSSQADALLLNLPQYCLERYSQLHLDNSDITSTILGGGGGGGGEDASTTSDLAASTILSDLSDYLAIYGDGSSSTNTEVPGSDGSNATTLSNTNVTLDAVDWMGAESIIAGSLSNICSSNNGSNPMEASMLQFFQHLTEFMNECSAEFVEPFEVAQDIQNDNSDAFESLSFNWIRCWPSNLREDYWFVFFPTEEIVVASRAEQQEVTFAKEWSAQQQELYEQYLIEEILSRNTTVIEEENETDETMSSVVSPATEEEDYRAFLRSIQDATGEATCDTNTGGTAWFFFTIMTTVGYGNQAPVTYEGRMLIYTAGIASLIIFGAVLGTSGYITLAIFNDMASRFWCSKFLKRPLVGVLLWGGIWLWWSVLIATDAEWWWERRLGLDPGDITTHDSLWFAYISTSTIGLGDYFLNPEVMFGSDALRFSVTFLIGFVFLANFFGKISELLASWFPHRQNSLEARLKSTRILACWQRGYFKFLHKHVEWVHGSNNDVTGIADETEIQLEEVLARDAEDRDDLKDRIYALEQLLPRIDGEEVDHHEETHRGLSPLELVNREKSLLETLLSQVEIKQEYLLNQQREREEREQERQRQAQEAASRSLPVNDLEVYSSKQPGISISSEEIENTTIEFQSPIPQQQEPSPSPPSPLANNMNKNVLMDMETGGSPPATTPVDRVEESFGQMPSDLIANRAAPSSSQPAGADHRKASTNRRGNDENGVSEYPFTHRLFLRQSSYSSSTHRRSSSVQDYDDDDETAYTKEIGSCIIM